MDNILSSGTKLSFYLQQRAIFIYFCFSMFSWTTTVTVSPGHCTITIFFQEPKWKRTSFSLKRETLVSLFKAGSRNYSWDYFFKKTNSLIKITLSGYSKPHKLGLNKTKNGSRLRPYAHSKWFSNLMHGNHGHTHDKPTVASDEWCSLLRLWQTSRSNWRMIT